MLLPRGVCVRCSTNVVIHGRRASGKTGGSLTSISSTSARLVIEYLLVIKLLLRNYPGPHFLLGCAAAAAAAASYAAKSRSDPN